MELLIDIETLFATTALFIMLVFASWIIMNDDINKEHQSPQKFADGSVEFYSPSVNQPRLRPPIEPDSTAEGTRDPTVNIPPAHTAPGATPTSIPDVEDEKVVENDIPVTGELEMGKTSGVVRKTEAAVISQASNADEGRTDGRCSTTQWMNGEALLLRTPSPDSLKGYNIGTVTNKYANFSEIGAIEPGIFGDISALGASETRELTGTTQHRSEGTDASFSNEDTTKTIREENTAGKEDATKINNIETELLASKK